ncbi:MAG: ribosome silencing factor [Candidatus Adiutrix sp.]|jgi:ribosome-associated protein|nr:ribosome silencing factor [Candidatus Adiutrix sp.]
MSEAKKTIKKAPPKTPPKIKPSGRELADLVVAAAAEHKPVDPVLLDLGGRSSVADWFFVASAENPRQMAAIAEKIIRRARENGVRPLGHEGLLKGNDRWVLVDLGEVIVHVFNLETRSLYDLEGLWADAPQIGIRP